LVLLERRTSARASYFGITEKLKREKKRQKLSRLADGQKSKIERSRSRLAGKTVGVIEGVIGG